MLQQWHAMAMLEQVPACMHACMHEPHAWVDAYTQENVICHKGNDHTYDSLLYDASILLALELWDGKLCVYSAAGAWHLVLVIFMGRRQCTLSSRRRHVCFAGHQVLQCAQIDVGPRACLFRGAGDTWAVCVLARAVKAGCVDVRGRAASLQRNRSIINRSDVTRHELCTVIDLM
eukprot:363637-Chlamydomonas_euryale.AAC.11